MINKYLLNFWKWWYGVQFKTVFHTVYSFWSLSLANLNIIPMFANLFVPMFQDRSLTGKFLSLMMRLVWIAGSSILMLFIMIPLVLILIIWLAIPLICIVQILRFFV